MAHHSTIVRTRRAPVARDHAPLAYRPNEASRVCGMSRTYLYEAMAAGRLEYFHVGRARLIPADALQRFLDAHRQPAA